MKTLEGDIQDRNERIDILKAICSFLVVCLHVTFSGIVGEYCITLARIAVPIFFMITGYFYPYVNKKHNGKDRQIIKIIKLMVLANGIYIVWDFFSAIAKHDLEYFINMLSGKKMIEFLIFNESPWGAHLWYLGAILYVLIIVAAINKMGCKKNFYYFVPILLCFNIMFGKYSLIFWGAEWPIYFTRNFLFVGIPYFSIGRLIAKGLWRNIKCKLLGIMIIGFSVTSLFECYVLGKMGLNATGDHYLSTPILAIVVFLYFQKSSLSNKILSGIGRKYSTWVYVLHIIFNSAISVVTNVLGGFDIYKCIAPVVVYLTTVFFLFVIDKLKNFKWRFGKNKGIKDKI